jgi:opacity protein-like surface antigen
MNKLLTTILLANLLLFLPLTPSTASTADSPAKDPPQDLWSIDVVPYLWLPTYSGTFDLPGTPAALPGLQGTTADSFSTSLSVVAMLSMRARYRDVGLYFDGAWLRLDTEGDSASAAYSGTEITSDLAYGMGAVTYRLPQLGRLKSDLHAGARAWYASNEIEFKAGTEPGFTTKDSRSWTDPLFGASFRYELGRRWYAVGLGDVGGFGVGSDLSWNVYGGIGYQFTDWFSTVLGYRYLHVDYEDNGFLMDANVHGLFLGLGLHF